MNYEKFRAHPIFILRNSRFLGFLIVFLLFRNGGKDSFMYILLLTALLAFRYKCFELSINKKEIYIRTGFLFVRRSVIPIKQISTVEILRSPTDRIFSSVSVKISTEATTRSSNFRFALIKRDTERLLQCLDISFGGKETGFSFKQVFVYAMAQSSVVNGILLTLPILNKAGALVGAELSKLVISEIDNIGNGLPYYSPVVNTLSLASLFFYLCALIFYVLVNLKFSITCGKENIKTAYGVLTHRSVYISRSLIGGYMSVQTPLMILFARSFLKADVAHTKKNVGKNVLLAPAVEWRALEKQFEHRVLSKENYLRTSPNDYYRFFKVPFLIFSFATLTAITLTQKGLAFRQVFLFFYCICLGYTLLRTIYAAHNCRKNKIYFGKDVLVHGSKGYELYDAHFFADKIGCIKILRFPLDKKNKTCSAKITLRTGNASSAKAKFVSYDNLINKINSVYNLRE